MGGSCGRVFDGDSNGARNILLRYLRPSLQAYRLIEGKGEPVFCETGPLRALTPSHRESPYGCSLCWHTPVFICHAYDKFTQVKNKATAAHNPFCLYALVLKL